MGQGVMEMKNGANYYLADLHVHTPLDKRFKGISGVDPSTHEGKKVYAKEYINAAIKKGVKILGITEHNNVSYIDAIREAAKGTDITIFPGFEISADSGAGGIHVIALFEVDADTDVLNDYITQLGLSRKDRFHSDGSPKIANKQLSEVIDFVDKHNGICIGAHVLNEHGILDKESMTGEPRVKAWKNEKLLAAEVNNMRSQLSGFAGNVFENNHNLYKRVKKIASVYFSDARSFDEIGSRATWIKVSNKNLGGLKQAFLDWESRIRHADELRSHKFSRILSAEWEDGFLGGLKIHFNNNLNCLIGGKGTGKSTVLETLRYVFGDKYTPEAERAKDQHKEILEQVFRKGSKIKVIVETHHPSFKRYIIERTFNSPPTVKDESGKLLPLKPCDVMELEAYGQKEIYEISKNPSFQLSLIDRFIGDRLDKLLDKEKALIISIKENAASYLRLKREIDNLDEQIGRLPKLEEQIERYKNSALPKRIIEKRQYEKESLFVQQVKESIVQLRNNFEIAKRDFVVDTPIPSDFDKYPNKKLLEQIISAIGANQKDIKSQLYGIEKSISHLENSVNVKDGYGAKWGKKYLEQEKRYDEMKTKLKKEFPDIDPEHFIDNENEINRLKPLRATKESKSKELTEICRGRKELLNDLYDNRREQFSIREKTCNQINKQLDGILNISVEYEGDTKPFVEWLKGLKSHAQQLDKIVENSGFSVQSFIEAVKEGYKKVANACGVSEASAKKLCDFISELKLLELEIFKIETRTTISLNVGTKDKVKYQNTDRLSVGQKCTAILTLILLENTYPLLIDQPEDDLDNTFIFSDIVQKLRKEKERRQFIIATHNANIPVLGDAELIGVLSADSDHGSISEEHIGSIDDASVRTPVETILEGGRDAFRMRKEKYGF